MNKRHGSTLRAIFTTPTPTGIRWVDVVSLFQGLGAVVSERAGSRVAVSLNGYVRVFHRPHPSPDTPRTTVRDVREFLTQAGVKP
jgi:hypothetical protein